MFVALSFPRFGGQGCQTPFDHGEISDFFRQARFGGRFGLSSGRVWFLTQIPCISATPLDHGKVSDSHSNIFDTYASRFLILSIICTLFTARTGKILSLPPMFHISYHFRSYRLHKSYR